MRVHPICRTIGSCDISQAFIKGVVKNLSNGETVRGVQAKAYALLRNSGCVMTGKLDVCRINPFLRYPHTLIKNQRFQMFQRTRKPAFAIALVVCWAFFHHFILAYFCSKTVLFHFQFLSASRLKHLYLTVEYGLPILSCLC